ncbi:MAG: CHASE2 domain-containing protein [Cyanobacteriota bacterium]
MRLLLRRALPYALAAMALLLLRHSRLAETSNLLLYDLAVQMRPQPSAADLPIRVIAIEEADLRQLGWPLEDRLLVAAIQRLERAGVGAIGLDLYRDLGVGTGQRELRRLAAAPGPLISVFSQIDNIGPIPGTPPRRQAYNDVLIDPDGVVRRDLLHVRGQGPAAVALPLRLLEHWRGQAISPLRARWEAQPAALAPLEAGSGGYDDLDDAGLQRMLVFHRPGSVPSWSLRALLAGQVPAERLRGSIVLIGSRAPSQRDFFLVPFGRQPWSPTVERMAGVDVHAHRLAALLALERGERLGVVAAPSGVNTLLLVGAIAAGVGLGEGLSSLRRGLQAMVLAGVAGLSAGWLALWLGGVWLGLALPLAGLITMATAALTGRGMEQQLQRQQLEHLLGQTLSPSVVRELWNQREVLLAGDRFRAQQRSVTVLFADIEQFTALAERLQPAPLLHWLNQVMECLVHPILEEGGLVNKFTGDGVLAVFGAPLSQGEQADATAAVRAALAIREALRSLNTQLLGADQPPVRLRLGLHSGMVSVGSIGSHNRWEYGVIGDVVNCASRIDGLRQSGLAAYPARGSPQCRILLSGATRGLLRDAPCLALRWQAWGPHTLSGRARQEEIWELLDPQGPEGAD